MHQDLLQTRSVFYCHRVQKKALSKGILVGICLFLSMVMCGCGGVPKHPVSGHFGPFPIQSTVDAPIAKRYLEAKLSTEEQTQLSALKQQFENQLPTVAELNRISEQYSVDFASVFFAEQVLKVTKNVAVHRIYFQYLSEGENAISDLMRKEYVVLLVPGYDHIATGAETGANLKQAREILAKVKVKTLFAELNPVGSVEENASIIAKLIREHTTAHQKVVISGASSGGAAIHYAIGSLLTEGEAQRVKGWINLAGLMNGSRMVDWFNSSWRFPFFRMGLWFTRWNATSIVSMSTQNSQNRLKHSHLLEHLVVLNFMGLSLSGSITDSEFSQYDFMRDWGPNDGFSLLPEIILPHTLTVVAPESDHFFGEDPLIHLKALALLATVVDLAENRQICGTCWDDEGPFPSFVFKGADPPRLQEKIQDWSKELEIYRQLPYPERPSL